jgi:hypothetical protein
MLRGIYGVVSERMSFRDSEWRSPLTISILCFTMPYDEPAISLEWVDEDAISEIVDEG